MRILSLLGLFTGGLLLACGNNAALAQNQNKKTGKSGINESRFEQKVQAINEAAKKKGQMDSVLDDICNNVNLSLEQVRTLHRNHPNAGAGAILLAAVIGDETKQPAEKFLESRLKDHTWEEIAARNKVPMEKLDEKLDKVQSRLNSSQTPAPASASRGTQPR